MQIFHYRISKSRFIGYSGSKFYPARLKKVCPQVDSKINIKVEGEQVAMQPVAHMLDGCNKNGIRGLIAASRKQNRNQEETDMQIAPISFDYSSNRYKFGSSIWPLRPFSRLYETQQDSN